MKAGFALVGPLLMATACNDAETNAVSQKPTAEELAATEGPTLTLTRLDCGTVEFKDMNGFFSDRPGVYPPGPGKVTDSCYLIRHNDDLMIWDTGLPAETKDKPMVRDGMAAKITRTLADQLAELKIDPADVDVLGISHMHGDHIGQAAQFGNARLVMGKRDFEMLAGKPEDTLRAWRGPGKKVTLGSGDVDVFGDGSVVTFYLPGHTPDHMGLLVNLPSGHVLLTGDLYHSTIARQKRGVPPFNTSREETLKSMDRFEANVKEGLGGKVTVIIQHEPADIAKLPPFPEAAK